MDELLKSTVEYLKTRKQFGVPIGSFQTLQHRAADMFVALEQARSMSMFATMAADFDSAKERATAVAAAKVQIGKSGKFIGQQSIQLHGGIGMTQEVKIGHYFKRLTMIENTFGDTDYHLRRVTDAGAGWCTPADRHPPRKRGIQYAAAYRFAIVLEYWIARLNRAMTTERMEQGSQQQ